MRKRIEEIQARRNELAEELKGDVVAERMDEIEKEMAGLDTEETELRAKIQKQEELVNAHVEAENEARQAEKAEVRSADLGKVVKEEMAEVNEIQERAKRAMETGHVEMSAREVRSTLISTSALAKPTGVGDEIHDMMTGESSIIDMVQVEDLTGMSAYEEAYVTAESTASERTDGSANTASDPTFRVAKIEPMLINVTSYVSKNINRLTPEKYEQKIKALGAKALRQKVTDLIVNGESGKFNGIKIATNTSSEAIYDTLEVSSTTFGADLLKSIVFAYGGSDELGGNARLFLTKQDLEAFGKVRGTNEKKALFEIIPDAGNPNTGVIKEGGLIVPYSICSKLTSLSTSTQTTSAIQTMIYGDPKNFELGLFGPYTLEVSKDYKFAEGLLTIMGEAMVGGNIVVDDGFVVVTLAASEG